MTIEHARAHISPKPWGSYNLCPWASAQHNEAIGEIWFERIDTAKPDSALLLKLLFAKEALSIQVHPDDNFAQSHGMANGKTEAWYILSAKAGAQVAVGLKQKLSGPQLRQAILDGAIADMVHWLNVVAGDVVFVPAGTIHAIGGGLVVAEIQQRSDMTFRLFDYGRGRDLHVDQAVASANPGPAKAQANPIRLSDVRTILISCPFFVLERLQLPANTNWELDAECESWALVIGGDAAIGSTPAGIGEAFFANGNQTQIEVGRSGLNALLAYASSRPKSGLLRELDMHNDEPTSRKIEPALIHHQQTAGLPCRLTEKRP